MVYVLNIKDCYVCCQKCYTIILKIKFIDTDTAFV